MRTIMCLLVSMGVAAALLAAQAKPSEKASPAAQASTQKAPPAPTAKKKARRVMTDDDFDSTRNPKALQEAAAAEEAKTEKEKPQAPPDEIEQELKFLREQLKTTEAMQEMTRQNLEKYRKDAETAPDPIMKESTEQSISVTEQLQLEYKAKIEDIQAKIRALEKQKKASAEGKAEEKTEEKPEEKKP